MDLECLLLTQVLPFILPYWNTLQVRTHPLAAHLTPLQVELQPGEFLFVPAGSPHFVDNLKSVHNNKPGELGKNGSKITSANTNSDEEELVMALSGNFLDESNLQCAIAELQFLGITDRDARRLSARFKRKGFDSSFHHVANTGDSNGEGWVSWDAFKSGNHLTF
jgi:hypothetical protein